MFSIVFATAPLQLLAQACVLTLSKALLELPVLRERIARVLKSGHSPLCADILPQLQSRET